MRKKKPSQQSQVLREGGRTGLAFDLRGLRLPEASFDADHIDVTRRRGTIRFVCWRSCESASTAIEIRMALESFRAFVNSIESEPFAGRFKQWVDGHADQKAELGETPVAKETPKVESAVRAHIAKVSHVGSEALISFYSLPLGAVAEAIGGTPDRHVRSLHRRWSK